MLRETRVENGLLRGIPAADPRITAFKGVPFAAPPVGENRWKAPQPCENWEGIRPADTFGPIPMQDIPGLGTDIYCREWHVDPFLPMSEDCLYLNIWTSAQSASERMPVLFWIFGGGFQWGYTAEMEFDGERLARRGIVVVTAAYRLGVFGYMAHPEITKEAPGAPSNFGLLDQQAALRWVYRNISAFGGDPERITIAGQSAGGGSVLHQLAISENRSMIKGAVVMSGMIRHPEEDADIFRPLDLNAAEKRGTEFFEWLGGMDLSEARGMDAETLRDRYSAYAQEHPRMFPIRDGVLVKEDPLEIFMRGESAPVPVMAGNTEDEFVVNGQSIVERSVKAAFAAREKNGCLQKGYYYRFRPDIPGDDHPGTFHSCDLWFFFETLAKCSRPYEGRHYDLARQMCDYLALFVKNGDPNGTGSDGRVLPAWLPLKNGDLSEMEFTGAGALPGKQGGIRLADTGQKQAVNPYLPSWEYVPDGEPYVFGDRVYVYGSHDIFNGQTFCLGDYVCWSAPLSDLGNWHYEGIIYRKTQDPLNPDGRMCLYAPDVTVGPDGRYYLYYVLDQVSFVSAAVSDRPGGPFEFLGYVHYADGTLLGEKEGDEPQFDPGVLTEGEDTYLFTGFCPKGDRSRSGAMLTVLGPDMLTVRREPRIVVPGYEYSSGTGFEGHAFFEASSIRKKDGLYYFIYSSEVMHELCYAVSGKPEGPYTYGGVLISNCDLHIDSYKPAVLPMAYGANNHGSMVQLGDDWYIFYHRHTNDTWYSRQGCAEKLTADPDGKIRQAEMTSCGLNNGPLCDKGEYPAYLACNLFTDSHSMYVEKNAPCVVQDGQGVCGDGYLTHMSNGCCAGFKYFRMEDVTGVQVKTKGYFRGKIEIRTEWDGEALGEIPVENSNIWKTRKCSVRTLNGVHALYLTCRGEGEMSILSFELLHG